MHERQYENLSKYYEILSKIGEVYFGIVYKGRERITNELRAIKVINIGRHYVGKKDKESLLNKFIKEYENMNICSKNNINSIKCYEYFINDDDFIIIMELYDKTLEDLVRERKRENNKGFNENEILEIMRQLNNTFKIMNKNNISHNDLKLDNILIKYNENQKFTIKLSDYYYGYIGNDIYYRAPEMFENENIKDKYKYKCDLWSIGIIIYRLFFLEVPWKGQSIISIYIQIKEFGNKSLKKTGNNKLDDLILKLLEIDFRKRLNWDDYFNHPFFDYNNERSKDDYKNYYEILNVIGKGGYGNVYKGKDKETNEFKAIKVMNLNNLRENLSNQFEFNEIEKQLQSYINGFINEYENMSICSWNNINSVRCYEYFISNDYFVIIMELCDKNLAKLLMERKRTFNEKEIFEIMKQLNNAFKVMKENKIIHRDLKLENILIKYNEDKTFTLKLSDYGCSKRITSFSRNFFNSIVGTNIYMAPEILKEEQHNYKCDLWSIGVIIYKLFFGNAPFLGLTETALKNNIEKEGNKHLRSTKNKDLDDLIQKLLEKDIEKRLTWDDYFNHAFFKYKNNINLIYETEEDKIENIFGETFVENNRNNIGLIINGEKTELISQYKLKKGINNIEIIIKNKLTNLEYMFYKCNKLKNIDELAYLCTEKVNNFSYMFSLCSLLSNIKILENWDVSSGRDFKGMFIKCYSLLNLKGIENWNVSNSINFSCMFRGCKLLKDLYELKNWNVSNSKNFSGMFRGCLSIKDINILEKWDVSNGEDFSDMFQGCLSLTNINTLENWNVSRGKKFIDMFQGCSSLSGIKELKKWNIMEEELI